MIRFEDCIDYVLVNEGGYVNNPADTGGATNMGITLATLSRWRSAQSGHITNVKLVTSEDVKALTRDEAKKIYLQYYWEPLKLNNLNHKGVATCILDMAVLRGTSKSIMYAQKTCNSFIPITNERSKIVTPDGIEVDGRSGTLLISRINSSNPEVWISTFVEFLRKAFIQITLDHPTKKVFLAGWLKRCSKMMTLINSEVPYGAQN